jgi:sigma-B regulation protein RsbU (phosphoserine phosphatase)
MQLVRDLSQAQSPQELMDSLMKRVGFVLPADQRISLSRRGLGNGSYRITRSTRNPSGLDPWAQKDRLPVLHDGLLVTLARAAEAVKIDDLIIEPDDPALPHVSGMRSLIGTPLYHDGSPEYYVFLLRERPDSFTLDELSTFVLVSNLVGRTTSQLVLAQELRQAYQEMDRELQALGRIQRDLLPKASPEIPGIAVATYYEPSARAGGDYYDFFRFPDGQWGVLIADASGHGAGPAVVMAMMRTMMRSQFYHALPPNPNPGAVLQYLNRNLIDALRPEQFVTAFVGLFNERTRELRYATAGHPAPRWLRAGSGAVEPLEVEPSLPLGVVEDYDTFESAVKIRGGDRLILFTDGYSEAFNRKHEMFGTEGIDAALSCCARSPHALIESINNAVKAFADGLPADDDRTLIAIASERD